jgi:hypothetical protein
MKAAGEYMQFVVNAACIIRSSNLSFRRGTNPVPDAGRTRAAAMKVYSSCRAAVYGTFFRNSSPRYILQPNSFLSLFQNRSSREFIA